MINGSFCHQKRAFHPQLFCADERPFFLSHIFFHNPNKFLCRPAQHILRIISNRHRPFCPELFLHPAELRLYRTIKQRYIIFRHERDAQSYSRQAHGCLHTAGIQTGERLDSRRRQYLIRYLPHPLVRICQDKFLARKMLRIDKWIGTLLFFVKEFFQMAALMQHRHKIIFTDRNIGYRTVLERAVKQPDIHLRRDNIFFDFLPASALCSGKAP